MNRNELQLLAELSDPDEGTVAAVASLTGNIMLLGAGGKMGYGVALMALRAAQMAGTNQRIIAVSRFTDSDLADQLKLEGIETIACDLLDPRAVQQLPDAANVIAMAGHKFGITRNPGLSWQSNVCIPFNIVKRFCDSQIVVLSSGNVYPYVDVDGGGAVEATPLDPVSEYGWTVVGRERIYDQCSRTYGTPMSILRLSYANEPRYGVLVDIAMKVRRGEPIDLTMGHVNVAWATDVNRVTMKAFTMTDAPPAILNVAGSQTLHVRELAELFGEAFGLTPNLVGEESATALLSNSSSCWQRFGEPEATVDYMIRRVAEWIMQGNVMWDIPTRYEVRSGEY